MILFPCRLLGSRQGFYHDKATVVGFYGPKMPIIRICEVMLKEGEKEQEGTFIIVAATPISEVNFPIGGNWIPGFAEGRTAKKKKNSTGRNKKASKKDRILMIFTPHLTSLIMVVGGVIDRMTRFNCF